MFEGQRSCASVTGSAIFPDEILLRHARAAAGNDKLEKGGGQTQSKDMNRNPLVQSETTLEAAQFHKRFSSYNSNSSQEIPPGSIPTEALNRGRRSPMEESFREERKSFCTRIEELEIHLAMLNAERRDEEERLRELERKNHSLSQELTKALLKNSSLIDENDGLKSTQLTLSSRVSSMEEKLHRLDAPSQESMKSLLKRLEKRESGLKNQAKRLAQLESYYARELNLISYGAAGRRRVPEIQIEDSVTLLQPHPSSNYVHRPSSIPEPPKKYPTVNNEQCGGVGGSTYSELYYKTITDKAISLIKRETGNCSTLLHKYDAPGKTDDGVKLTENPNVLDAATSSDTDQDIEVSKTQEVLQQGPQGESANSAAECNDEEEKLLRLLFYKF